MIISIMSRESNPYLSVLISSVALEDIFQMKIMGSPTYLKLLLLQSVYSKEGAF